MAKLNKHAEIIEQLHGIMQKESQAKATGIAGADTHFKSTEDAPIDKNKVKPETLEPQKHEQHASSDPAAPAKKAEETAPVEEAKTGEPKAEETKTAEAKPAEPVKEEGNAKTATEIGKELLVMIDKIAQAKATGVAGADTHYKATEDAPIDKNKVKPDTLAPQKHEQHASTDPAAPAKKAEVTDEEAVKLASHEFGKLLAESLFKSAQEKEVEMYKEAGRRDFDTLITFAAEKLAEANKKEAPTALKTASVNTDDEAEAAGAEAFNILHKQAQEAQQQTLLAKAIKEAQELEAKVAQFEQEKLALAKKAADAEAKIAEFEKQAAEQREMQKYAALAEHITNAVVERLKQTPA